MASETPLIGVVLVDCARANAERGLAIATKQCGYGDDTESFQAALKSACSDMGVDIEGLSDLLESTQQPTRTIGIEIAPKTQSDL